MMYGRTTTFVPRHEEVEEGEEEKHPTIVEDDVDNGCECCNDSISIPYDTESSIMLSPMLRNNHNNNNKNDKNEKNNNNTQSGTTTTTTTTGRNSTKQRRDSCCGLLPSLIGRIVGQYNHPMTKTAVSLDKKKKKKHDRIVAGGTRTTRRIKKCCFCCCWYCSMVLVVILGFLFSIVGLPFPDRQLPKLDPLPTNPQRAYATLFSDSNPCYDMLLYVCLSTWIATNSKYPMLVLHSVPLPTKVQTLIDSQQHHHQQQTKPKAFLQQQQQEHKQEQQQWQRQEQQQQQQTAGQIIAVSIPVVKNYFVIKDRVRTASAKFAVWDQTKYDQVAYFDTDTIFFESGDSIFDDPMDGIGHLWLYARPYMKYWQHGIHIFNSGNFILRPNTAVYHKLLDLFQRRFWIVSFQQFFKTADQGFLNAIFAPSHDEKKKYWDLLQLPNAQLSRVKHVKFWLAVTGESKYNITKQDQMESKQLVQDLQLQQDLESCLNHRRYSN